MKLLLDANISWRLSVKLKIYFEDCFHADNIGLAIPAKDIDIWNYGRLNGLIIVTNDEDFLNLANIKGFPPKIILLRTGNQSTAFIESILIKHINDINNLYFSNEYGLLEIF
jgi:predicted nuclease of predicted toxin-antitoxin system